MKLKLVLLSAAAALAGSASALAQNAVYAPPAPSMPAAETTAPGGYGLIGANYADLSYDYFSIRGGPPSAAHGFTVDGSERIGDNFATTLDYDWRRAHSDLGTFTRNRVFGGAQAFAVTNWGKPFVEGDIGWEWNRTYGVDRSSLALRAATGLEVKITSEFAMAPYVAWERATGYNASQFDYGMRANLRLTRAWGVTAKAEYQDGRHTAASLTYWQPAGDIMQYSLGFNYRY